MGRIFAIVCLFFLLLCAGKENSCGEDDGTFCGYEDREFNKPIAEIFAPDSEIIAEYCAEYFEPEKYLHYTGARLERFILVKQLKEFIKLQMDTIPELLHCRVERGPYNANKGGRELLYMGISGTISLMLDNYKVIHDTLNHYATVIYRNYYDTIYLGPPEYINFPELNLCPIPKKSVENHYGKLLQIKNGFHCEPPPDFYPKYITLYIRITGECSK